MDGTTWAHRPPPAPSARAATVWRGQVRTAAELTRMRMRLRGALAADGLPEATGEQLLLAVEELVSNGLRHGRPPVTAAVTADGGWLLEVSDAARDCPPVPAVDRDAAAGGMGLPMVARLSAAHGWHADGDGKTVWAWLGSPAPPALLLPERVARASQRARELGRLLADTDTRLAATFDRLTAEAAERGRADRADTYRTAARRFRRDAAQGRRAARRP
ncbi:ATP-binding protein [Geodermatophilus sp. SYSU D00684]